MVLANMTLGACSIRPSLVPPLAVSVNQTDSRTAVPRGKMAGRTSLDRCQFAAKILGNMMGGHRSGCLWEVT